MKARPLTLLSSRGGCAAKIEPVVLQEILMGLRIDAPGEFASIDRKEDVGIVSLPGKERLAQSIDMITPVSDDPGIFGAVAASHALSDLYAKGAHPLSGLLLLGLPPLLVPPKIAIAILQGAIDKLHEAGARFLGGHTIASQELQLGVSVTGSIQEEPVPNSGCQVGDVLVLTKPLGTGIVVTALKLQNGGESIDHFSDELVHFSERSMLSLNEASAQVMMQVGANACTDVTGFGLLGHLSEMLASSQLSAQIYWSQVPVIPGAIALASQDILSAGGERNAVFYWQHCAFADTMTYAQKMVLFDPQTSGGLLISVSHEKVDLFLKKLQQRDVDASVIGRITQRETALITVAP